MLLTVYGTEWPILCRCAVKKLLTRSLGPRDHQQEAQGAYTRQHWWPGGL